MPTTYNLQAQRSTGDGGQVFDTLAVQVQDGLIIGDSAAGGSVVQVRTEGGSLIAGDLVYISGWNETLGLPLVTKADADVSGKQAQFVMRAAIADNSNGMAFTAWRSTATLNVGGTVGDPVYLSATAGAWTVTTPTGASTSVQIVGRVAIVSATVGVIAFDLRDMPTMGTNDIQALAVTPAKIALPDTQLLVGDATGAAAAVALSGDATIVASGVLTLAATSANVPRSTSPSLGVGYATGAGGTVTQATSKVTAFTLSKITGQITMAGDLLAASTAASSVWTNTAIAATDTVVVNHVSGGTIGAYLFNVACGAGTATLTIRNLSLAALTEAPVVQFTVIKGVNA